MMDVSGGVLRMRVSSAVVVALVLAGLKVKAEEQPILPEEFDRMTVGRIVEYIEDGHPDGQEAHLPGRVVIWRNTEGECQFGRWEPREAGVCFTYENEDEENCVSYFRNDPFLLARERNGKGGLNTYVLRIFVGPPLQCPGA
jgi:hypothetical protein